MGKFLLKIALFSAIMIGILYGVEMALTLVPHPVSIKARYIKERPKTISTLILGNSHGYMGLVPSVLGDSTFNNAYCSKSLYIDYRTLVEEVETMKNLKCVLWNLSYNFHTFDLHHVDNYDRDSQSYIRNKFYKYFDIAPVDGIPYVFWWETIWGGPDGPAFPRIYSRPPFDYSTYGWWANSREGRDERWQEMSRIDLDTDYESSEARERLNENIAYAVKMAEICQQKGLRLVVVSLPCHDSSVSRFCDAGLNEMRMCVEAMKRAYPEMEYYDYLTDSRFGDDDFFDSTHLNIDGAKRFSEIFRNEALYSK